MTEEITRKTADENVDSPKNLQETLEKERIETSDGFVWTVTIKIRKIHTGQIFIGVGACNSTEGGPDKKMSENEVLNLARERARKNAMEELDRECTTITSSQKDLKINRMVLDTMQRNVGMINQHPSGKRKLPDIHKLQEDVLKDVCKNIDDEELFAACTVPEPADSYGEGSAGLIWIFHNRLLPIKFILRVIAEQIVAEKKQHIDFEVIKEAVRDELVPFTDYIRGLDLDPVTDSAKKGKRKTGFPHTYNTARLSPKMRKFVDRNSGEFKTREGTKTRDTAEAMCTNIVNSSTDRFIYQFFGRQDKKRTTVINKKITNVAFLGACFEMGLLLANTNLEVTFTKRGLDFVCCKNPVFDMLENPASEDYSILSKDEVTFFMNEVVSQKQFGLEQTVMKKILGSNSPLLVEDIVKALADEQNTYIKKERGVSIDSDLQKNLVDYRQTRAITTASRLVEMGLLEKGSSKNETVKLPPRTTYSITSFGKEIYEEILSKNS